MSIMGIASSALNAYSVGVMSIANNVANVNTNGFQAGRVQYQDAPYGNGVQVAGITKETSGAVPGFDDPNNTSVGAQEAAREAEAQAAMPVTHAPTPQELSNVQLEREFTDLISHENAISANAVLVRTYDDMMGTMIDVVV